MGILLAVVAAAAWGASSIFARLGFRSIRPFPGTFVSMLSTLAIMALVIPIFQGAALVAVTPWAVLWFAMVGLITFPFARLFHFRGVELLGASRAAALAAAAPLFAMLVAMVFLQERLTPAILAGILSIVGGLAALAGRQEKLTNPADPGHKAIRRAHVLGYTFSLLSALGWGGSTALTRWGVTHLAPPLVGGLLSVVVGTASLSWPGLRNLQYRQREEKVGLAFFLLAGVVSAIGIVANYSALRLAPVIIVSPLANISPLFTLLFVLAFLRGWERITWRTVLGAVLIIAGSILIALGRL